MEKGHLKFRLDGQKLKGEWTLVRIRGGAQDEDFDESSKDNWLLIKSPEEKTKGLEQYDVTAGEPLSVKTGRTMEAIAAQKTAFWAGPAEASDSRHQSSEAACAAPCTGGSSCLARFRFPAAGHAGGPSARKRALADRNKI